jgi:hypothetical protein
MTVLHCCSSEAQRDYERALSEHGGYKSTSSSRSGPSVRREPLDQEVMW